MSVPLTRRVKNRLKSTFAIGTERFLRDVPGVIHIGANTGQERDEYRRFGLRVLWVEPIPRVFERLSANLRGYPDQRAVQCLVTDRDGAEYEFHVASNNGASSSILDLKLHQDIWPEVQFKETLKLTSVTLASLLQQQQIDPADYPALVMDTQGSELLVLQGGLPVLRHFDYVKTEVPDFESYAGCCQLAEVDAFMRGNGFAELHRDRFATRAQGGSYYDVLYKRSA